MLYNDIYSHFHRLYLESLSGYRVYGMSVLKCLCVDKHSNYYMMRSALDFSILLLQVVLEPVELGLIPSFYAMGKW